MRVEAARRPWRAPCRRAAPVGRRALRRWALMAAAAVDDPRRSGAGRSERSRKWRPGIAHSAASVERARPSGWRRDSRGPPRYGERLRRSPRRRRSGRQEPHDIVAGADGDSFSARSAPRSRQRHAVRRPSIRPSPRISARRPDSGRSIWRGAAAAAARIVDAAQEAVLQHDVEHGVADRHGQRVAAEGGAMRAAVMPWRPRRSQGTRRAESRRRCPWRSP